ncbi:MAG TPA: hypothetical protein VJH90_00255 [archaeon]|nr:hypothetical protein [archaeon]
MAKLVIEVVTSQFSDFSEMALEIARKVANDFDDVEVKEIKAEEPEGKEIIEYLGIDSFPAILIDGEPHFMGVPREENLRAAVREFLSEKNE